MVINGPNLNLLGKREPGIYGSKSFDEVLHELQQHFSDKCTIAYYQSNVEGELINKLHEVGFDFDGIVLNAGGYTHTSVALADAVAAISSPVVEVHISNIFARESFRHVSLLSPHCKGIISGMGTQGYEFAISFLLSL
jgi:3-dehydroquinate dehydratase-2